MPDDKPTSVGSGAASVPERHDPSAALAYGASPPSFAAFDAEETSSVDWRRYVFAIFRYKWLLVVALAVGLAGAYVAWNRVEVRYTAQGSLWIEVEDARSSNSGDVAPIQTSGLLESSAWIELLKSYEVLDSVTAALRLYIHAPPQYQAQFASLQLKQRAAFGAFELRIGADGTHYVLASDQGTVVEEGQLGEPIGESLGYTWMPPAGSFPAGATIPFSIIAPREAANGLQQQLVPLLDQSGNFLRISLEGNNPQRITEILTAVMERHVELAAELKRAKVEEVLSILEDQLTITENDLADAERRLEEFRVSTITFPSDRAPIQAGLEETRDPVFDRYFDMSVELDEVNRSRARLRRALDESEEAGEISIESLEVIPAARESSELQRILDDLVTARSQLRVYRNRYSDDYQPVQELLRQIETMEGRAIPRVVEGIISNLQTQQRDLRERIADAGAELEAIPPRTIEEQRLSRLVGTAETLYTEIRGRVETARLAAASSIPDVRILDVPQVPQRPSQDNRLPLAAMIFFGCLGAAVGGAILLDRMDARFRYASDVSRDIGLDILGSVPRITSGNGKHGVLNAAQALEAFRELRIHVGFAYGSAGPITLTISSPSEGEGKSLIASNLAVAFSEVGRRTLLIDGDTRRGDAHRLVGCDQAPGLIDYLKERSGQEIIQRTDHENLDFIGCGSRGSSTPELLASSRMAHFMGTLKRSYDVIVVDSPPLASGGDPLILSTLTGNLAIVIRTGTTERALAQAKLEQLSRLPIRLLGAILNDVDPSDGYHYYYSAYLPGYEPVPEEGEEGPRLISGKEA
jgi:capsular exopolysaccharide synthesis family protein